MTCAAMLEPGAIEMDTGANRPLLLFCLLFQQARVVLGQDMEARGGAGVFVNGAALVVFTDDMIALEIQQSGA